MNEAPDSLNYLYKEYVRQSENCNSYIRSSFDDFKLLGSIGVLLTWLLSVFGMFGEKWIVGIKPDSINIILLFGFIFILSMVTIIATRDLLKQSLVFYSLPQLCAYEEEIRAKLNQTNENIFHYAVNWAQWGEEVHNRLILRFHALFYLILLGVPLVVFICLRGNALGYAGIYLFIAFIFAGIFMNAFRILRKKLISLS